jgi:hypothetical protein
MKRIVAIAVFLSALICCIAFSGYAQDTLPPAQPLTKTADVNNDGTPDVSYYSDGKYVSKVAADTDFDGIPDVVVKIKDGKFEIAQVDSDNNGTVDREFTDVSEFNKWLNKDKPEFNEYLNRPEWGFPSISF